jgi:predicted Zn finger-like uncharacterized protein
MDVQCERCKAEYEFDDALVSGRGTTVKCTACGYQFKIRRASEQPGAAPDRWQVQTTEGQEIVFTSLRELQKAILARQVGRADVLVRNDGSARALGVISELESFFEEASAGSSSGARPAPDGSRRGASIAPGSKPKMMSSRPPPPMAHRATPALRPMPTPTAPPVSYAPASHLSHLSHPSHLMHEPMRPRVDTIRPDAAVPPPSAKPAPMEEVTDETTVTRARGAAVSVAPVITAGNLAGIPAPMPMPLTPSTTGITEHTPPMPVHMHTSDAPPLPLRAHRAPPNPPAPSGRTLVSALATTPSHRPPPPTIQPFVEPSMRPPTVPVKVESYRESMASAEVDELELPGAPRRLGGWLVALVLVLGAGVIGFAVAKPYLAARTAQSAARATALDPRAAQLLGDGERAMASGDLDSANEDFAKASALAESDPRVAVDVARLANARADVPWLRLKILPADAADDRKAIKSQLDDLSARARKAADEATTVAPDAQGAALAKIDALRLSGDSTGARTLVSKIAQNGSQPETAYVLAALDLGEPQPVWPMVIERLRIAAAGEGDAGRARAALVYALAQSGDATGARAELEKLGALARPSPLVGALRAFIGVAGSGATNEKDGGVSAPRGPQGGASSTATVDVSALPHASSRGGGGGNPNDPRLLLQQAESAKEARDWDRARALYSSALAQNAADSEALAGLGDCDHGTRDFAGAASYYHRALAVNPVYLPALIGLADVEWETGDRDEAQKTYHDITDRFPEGTYPARVKQRANDSSAGAPTPRAASTESPAAAAAPTPRAASTESPAAAAAPSDSTGAP